MLKRIVCFPQESLNIALEQIESKLSKGVFTDMCRKVVIGGIYLAAHEDPKSDECHSATIRVYRVQVQEIDDTQKMALCVYIDDGYEEWLSFDLDDTEKPKTLKIYRIPRELLNIPPQAIHFSLFNLEDFADNQYAKDEIIKHLRDKECLVKPKTTQSQYEMQQLVESNATINAMFYDINASVDILMNKRILENVCGKFHVPQLEENKTVVYVTHINETGDIYCRLSTGTDIQQIEKLLNRFSSQGIDKKYRVTETDLSDITTNNLRLAYDSAEKRCYRATILPSRSSRDNLVLCRFVDYGNLKYIQPEHIFKLEKLSTALNRFPPQTIVVRLSELNDADYTPNVIKRLQRLLCHKEPPLIVQPVNRSVVPMVNIWKRVNGLLCKINDTIRMELEMEK